MDLALGVVAGVSISIALVSLLIAFRTWMTGEKSIDTLEKVRGDIDIEFNKVKSTNEDTQSLIARLTNLFNASEREGLEMVYPNRLEASSRFAGYIDDEKAEVVIIGSSLLGLRLFIPGFEDTVRREPNKFKVILTHPDESQKRENPEGRARGRIRDEIIEGLEKLGAWGVPLENVRLYRGAPSVFLIAASGYMLLNPYPYCTEAYRCFCLQVSSRGSIYDQYYEHHFRKVWDSDWVEPGSAFLAAIGNVPTPAPPPAPPPPTSTAPSGPPTAT